MAGGTEDKEHAMSQKLDTSPAVIGIDIGKNSFHIVGQNQRGAIVLREAVRFRPSKCFRFVPQSRRKAFVSTRPSQTQVPLTLPPL